MVIYLSCLCTCACLCRYLVVGDEPNAAGFPMSVVDALHNYYAQSQGKGMLCIDKFNFASVPHILEPVNLLQLEAYQSRMNEKRRMSYYTSVMPKCSFLLHGGQYYDRNTAEYVATCCHFHGCHGHDPRRNSTFCKDEDKKQRIILNKGGFPNHKLHINHYSRSVEKYMLKAQTWRTSGGEVKEGEDMVKVAQNYDINQFFARTLGWKVDRSALKYACQLRETLAHMTGQLPFLRHGTVWYRNVEFGKHLSIPEKRGRYGRPNPEGFHFQDGNPHHYHGSNEPMSKIGQEKMFVSGNKLVDKVSVVEK